MRQRCRARDLPLLSLWKQTGRAGRTCLSGSIGSGAVVIEALIDDARRENVFGLLMSLEDADRIRRRVRLLSGGFPQVLRGSRLQRLRGHPSGWLVKRRDRI